MPESVTKVGRGAFYGCTNLESVELSDGIKTIGSGAFEDCTSLDGVVLPSNLQCLEYRAFCGCTSLSEIVLPDSCTSLGADYRGGSTFEGCTSLKKVVLPDTLTTIPGRMFANCKSLSEINIPSDVRKIGGEVFEGCTSLTEVELPEGLLTVGARVFKGSGIKSITIPSTVEDLDDGGTFTECTNLESVTLPESLYLPDGAFYGGFTEASLLKKLVVPEGVTTIKQGAISHCGVETLYLPSTLEAIEYQGIERLDSLRNLIVKSNDEIDLDTRFFLIDLPENDYLTVFAPEGSYAEEFFTERGVQVVDSDNEDLIKEVLVRKHVLGITSTYDEDLDVNGDGKVNVLDTVQIKRDLLD
jgi:hypothetical protein